MSLGSAPPFAHFADQGCTALITALRQKVAPILANNLLPHFTDHTVGHSDNLVRIVDQLVVEAKRPLSDPELMILYSACYLHDIGMQYERADSTKVITDLNLIPPWNDQSDANRRELLRRYHHRISAEMVQLSVGTAQPPIGFQLTPEFNASYIARLCHAHAIATNTAEYRDLVQDGPNIRMRLLSALLRIADILDESRRRALSEKAQTLLLDLESQKHWWRHYFTEDVTFDVKGREVIVWFDFPDQMRDEYCRVVPELQMPWIRSEFEYHISVLLENGCQWTTSHRAITKPYSDTVAMPDDVLTGMLKELAERRRTRDEKLRLAAFTQLKEARPNVERRLESLKDREETLSAGEYLLELSQVALDLYDLGGRRAARSLLYSRFQRDIQKVTLDARLRIGLTLLNWEVAAGNNFETMSLLESLTPEFEGLEPSDERKLRFMRLRIMAIDLAGAYDEAKSAIIDAIPVLPTNEQPSIEAELAEMSLLRGDITRSED